MTEFKRGDIVKTSSNIPSLVIAYSAYGIVTRRFNFLRPGSIWLADLFVRLRF